MGSKPGMATISSAIIDGMVVYADEHAGRDFIHAEGRERWQGFK